jgi:nitrite reductase/ring-hydroxylating ferredoxin subunit
MSESVRLCAVEDVPDSGARGFTPPACGAHPLFAVRRGRAVFVYRDECPHLGAQLAWCRHEYLSADGRHIVCFAHGARFEIETGLCVEGPCLGQSLTPVPQEVDAEGQLRLIG